MITVFDKQIIATLKDDIDQALNAVAEKHGLHSIQVSPFSYNSFRCQSKIEVLINAPNFLIPPEIQKKLDARPAHLQATESLFLSSWGLPTNLIGKIISVSNKTFVITHLDRAKPKNPIIGATLTGKYYKFSPDQIRNCKILN